jgi:hypothetical protein
MIQKVKAVLLPEPRPPWQIRLAANIITVPLASWVVMLLAGATNEPVSYGFMLAVATAIAGVAELAETAIYRHRGKP